MKIIAKLYAKHCVTLKTKKEKNGNCKVFLRYPLTQYSNFPKLH